MNPEAMWQYRGQKRPDFAIAPGPGEESVWDYPRPPRLVPDARRIEVRAGGVLIACSTAAMRILETASPPTVYLPSADVDMSQLVRIAGSSGCEWKGVAGYWALAANPRTPVGWSYESPLPAFAAIRGALSFYPALLECTVDGERVRPQPGGFYGGWITKEIVGPVKGVSGSGNW
jgi:uncharacterized protein (DUF427 family)